MNRGHIILTMVILALAAASPAETPRLGVVSIDDDALAPDNRLIDAVEEELAGSGRFEVVDLEEEAFITVPPDSLICALRTLAARHSLDVFLALEVLPLDQEERTEFRNDSLVTTRTVSAEVLGRFYGSSGRLIGTISNSETEEGTLPFAPDPMDMVVSSGRELAERALLELFPIEGTFTAAGGGVLPIPLGTEQGIRRGMVMRVLASAEEIPTTPEEYDQLRSRGLLQIVEAERESSTGRLLSGRVVEGGEVVVVESSPPAFTGVGYSASLMEIHPSDSLIPEPADMVSHITVQVMTGAWGLSFGGALKAGGIEHASMLGVELLAGGRIPVSSPALALRLAGGGELTFLMQDARSDSISSTATALAASGKLDASLELLLSEHLALQLGAQGVLGTTVDTWTVQEYTGIVRDALPGDIYYDEMGYGPVSLRVGLLYMIF